MSSYDCIMSSYDCIVSSNNCIMSSYDCIMSSYDCIMASYDCLEARGKDCCREHELMAYVQGNSLTVTKRITKCGSTTRNMWKHMPRAVRFQYWCGKANSRIMIHIAEHTNASGRIVCLCILPVDELCDCVWISEKPQTGFRLPSS